MILREIDVTALPRPVFACGAKNQCPPIGLKITMGKLWTSPDTMAVLVLRENDVTALPRPVFACGAKNRCRPIELKINMEKLWTSPDTMAVMNLREIHDLALWAWFCGHVQKRKNEKEREALERQS